MTWQKRNPPGERRAPKNCAQASDFYNEPKSKPFARQLQVPPTGSTAAEIIAELRFRRNVEQMHSLGARANAELLAELGAERGIQHVIDEKVAHYAAMDLHHLTAMGGDRFARPPLTVVPPADEGER